MFAPRLSTTLSRLTTVVLLATSASGCTDAVPPDPVVGPPSPALPPRDDVARREPPLSPVTGELNGGCAPEGTSGHQTIACADGVTFDIDIPTACLAGGCGVIVDVHGWSMTGPMMARHSRLSLLAGSRRYIVINPSAPGDPPSWAAGDSPFSKDFAYDPTVWSFVEATVTRFHGDDRRLHVTGFSQGAMMAFRMAFEHADRVASVAPIAGPYGFVEPEPFRAAKPTGKRPPSRVPILYIHGTKDRELRFNGNADVLRDAIMEAYGLGASEVILDTSKLRAARYRDDRSKVALEFWEHDYVTADLLVVGGHCVPGPVEDGDGHYLTRSPSERPFRCIDDDQQMDSGKEILRFFEEHPRSE